MTWDIPGSPQLLAVLITWPCGARLFRYGSQRLSLIAPAQQWLIACGRHRPRSASMRGPRRSTEPRAAKGVTSGPPAAVEFGVKKNNHLVEGLDGLAYTARLPLSSATLNWLAALIRGHLKKIGSRWRALPRRHRAGGTAL
ncbi:hypothetical protein [Streptomyces afghaniensis]|uniref:hypothetical protein n=1 Tax=Streptomyces afghaniensis TaxID=66865 RepID=UPI0037B1F52A